MTLVGRSITEKVPAGPGKTVDKVTRVLSTYTEEGNRYYKIKVMTPGFGCVLPVRAETIEKKFNDHEKNICI